VALFLLLVKENAALTLFVNESGPVTIVVSGEAESTVHAYVAGVGSTLPAESRARTLNVWLPSLNPINVSGLLQVLKAAPSKLHS
jgi:redox-regulated HSP33 family molecular chaperone